MNSSVKLSEERFVTFFSPSCLNEAAAVVLCEVVAGVFQVCTQQMLTVDNTNS